MAILNLKTKKCIIENGLSLIKHQEYFNRLEELC